MRFTCLWIHFLNEGESGKVQLCCVLLSFLTKRTQKWPLRAWFLNCFLFTRGKSYFRTRKPVRAIKFNVFSGVRITCFWTTFTLIFYWRKSGHSSSYVLLRITCMWGSSCKRGLTCTSLPLVFISWKKPQHKTLAYGSCFKLPQLFLSG